VATGLLQKVDKAKAFRYSFLLSVPAIIGATIMEVIMDTKDLAAANANLAPLLLGTTVSMIVGYASLKLLKKIVMNKKFHLFAYYCWAVGLAIILFTLLH
jgi:undecaprenyl-diphosphatase